MKIVKNAIVPVLLAGLLAAFFYFLVDYLFGNTNSILIGGTVGGGVAGYYIYKQNYLGKKM